MNEIRKGNAPTVALSHAQSDGGGAGLLDALQSGYEHQSKYRHGPSVAPGDAVNRTSLVFRDSALAFWAHGVLAASILLVERYRTGGASIGDWDTVKLLRLLELPVLWAIDGILQWRYLIPLSLFYPNFELAAVVNVITTYVLVGGAFYAALTATLSFWLRGGAID